MKDSFDLDDPAELREFLHFLESQRKLADVISDILELEKKELKKKSRQPD